MERPQNRVNAEPLIEDLNDLTINKSNDDADGRVETISQKLDDRNDLIVKRDNESELNNKELPTDSSNNETAEPIPGRSKEVSEKTEMSLFDDTSSDIVDSIDLSELFEVNYVAIPARRRKSFHIAVPTVQRNRRFQIYNFKDIMIFLNNLISICNLKKENLLVEVDHISNVTFNMIKVKKNKSIIVDLIKAFLKNNVSEVFSIVEDNLSKMEIDYSSSDYETETDDQLDDEIE